MIGKLVVEYTAHAHHAARVVLGDDAVLDLVGAVDVVGGANRASEGTEYGLHHLSIGIVGEVRTLEGVGGVGCGRAHPL